MMACIGAVRMARCSTSVGPRLSRQAGELCLARRLSTKPHDLVLLEHRDNVALITFNAPTRLNSLTVDMSTALHGKLDSLDWAKTGAVVFTGAGRAFSAGGDFEFLQDRSRDSAARNAEVMRRYYDLYLSIRNTVPVPMLAAINGPAVGAGLCLSMAMDIRIAAKSAKMGVTFVGIGLHPGMGSTHFLPKLVGPQFANRMLLTGDLITGEEAARAGLVLEAVDDDHVVTRTMELAKRMASQAPVAVRGCVRSLRMQADDGLDKALLREADAQSYCYSGPDMKEGVDAVMNKRKPSWVQYERYGWKP